MTVTTSNTAIALLVLGVALAEPVSRALAAARWPARDPVGALLLWQAVGLAGGLALLGAGVLYGLSPLGDSLHEAVRNVRPRELGVPHWLALGAAAAVGVRLLGVLAATAVRTLRTRRRHRDLLDLLATPWPAVPGARVLDHPLPVAYCLPGLRSRLVVSAGALDALTPAQLRAVIAHERAHLAERHDLVVLPFVAWGATARRVPGMVRAQVAVAALVEMRADDLARRRAGAQALTGALEAMSPVRVPAAATPIDAALRTRLTRIATPPPPLRPAARLAVRVTAAALVALPTAAVLLPG